MLDFVNFCLWSYYYLEDDGGVVLAFSVTSLIISVLYRTAGDFGDTFSHQYQSEDRVDNTITQKFIDIGNETNNDFVYSLT